MRKARIKFKCGDKVKEYQCYFYTSEEDLNIFLDYKISGLAKMWNVPQENISVEIIFVIRLR